MTDWRFPYPPPWQDMATLSAHICLSADTISKLIRERGFPKPCLRAGKQLWNFRNVDSWLADNPDIVSDLAEKVRRATREAVNG